MQPAKVELVKLPREMTLEQFNQQYPSSIPIEELAIINELESPQHGDAAGADGEAGRGRSDGDGVRARRGDRRARRGTHRRLAPRVAARDHSPMPALAACRSRLRLIRSNTPYHISRVSLPVLVFWRLGWNEVTSSHAVGQRGLARRARTAAARAAAAAPTSRPRGASSPSRSGPGPARPRRLQEQPSSASR